MHRAENQMIFDAPNVLQMTRTGRRVLTLTVILNWVVFGLALFWARGW